MRSRADGLARFAGALALAACFHTVTPGAAHAQPADETAPTGEFLAFIRAQAAALRRDDQPPETVEGWKEHAAKLRASLARAWGAFPDVPCPLEPVTLGTLKRDGYRVDRVVFQTLPGVRMTANLYVPDRPGRLPALLCVHGHWRGAKQDPVVQARCVGAAKLGFVVLVVDAFGAGERGIGEALGEYHGAMTGATLLPIGRPLSGIQVYENMRAIDYLRSRPEVDPERIGVTGASGGGNQTMYAAAWDDRLAAAVPVCSVGNFQAYLGAACCMCEVVPGALTFTEEWGPLALTAPRALMVVNATRDAVQFSVAEARKSITAATPIFRLLGQPGSLRHTVFESGHDYSQPMREAMYGWMDLHLRRGGMGDGTPIAEPEVQTEAPETLRCYPGETRPDDWMTLPRFALREGRALLASRTWPDEVEALEREIAKRRASLIHDVLGGLPRSAPLSPVKVTRDGATDLAFTPEAGIHLGARVEGERGAFAIVLDLDGGEKAAASDTARALRGAGWRVVTLDLRATGRRAWPKDKIGLAPDHNTAEWSLWVGRPLLGQWAHDVHRLIDALASVDEDEARGVSIVGQGPAGLVALTAAVIDPRVRRVATVASLATYLTDAPYQGQRLGLMAPGIVRDVGDVADLAALLAPRRLVVAGAVSPIGTTLGEEAVKEAFARTIEVWNRLGAARDLQVLGPTGAADLVRALE